VPFLIPLTTPVELTVANALFPDFQVTFLLLAFVGFTVALNFMVFPFFRDADILLNFTLVTGWVTVTAHVATLPPLTDEAIIKVVPLVFAVTFPVDVTEAILELADVHITALLEALVG